MPEITITISYQTTGVNLAEGGIMPDETAFLPAGVELCDALINYLKYRFQVSISKKTAQQAIHWVGSLHGNETHFLKIRTRNLFHGMLDWLDLTNHDIQRAIEPTIDRIVRNIAYKVRYHLTTSKADDCSIVLTGNLIHLDSLIPKLEVLIGQKLHVVEIVA